MEQLKIKIINFIERELNEIVDQENVEKINHGDSMYAIVDVIDYNQVGNKIVLNVRQYEPECDNNYLNFMDSNENENVFNFIMEALDEGKTNKEETIEVEEESLLFSRNLRENPLVYLIMMPWSA